MKNSFFDSTTWIWTRRFLLLGLTIVATTLISSPKFKPRTVENCLEAIGSLDSLAPGLHPFFSPGTDFELMGSPKTGEWLSQFPEKGQSFDSYQRAGFNRFAPPRNRLYIQPLGEFASGTGQLELLREYTEIYFAAPTVLLPTESTASPSFRTRINRQTGNLQLKTDDILEWLKQRVPEDAYCLIAVTPTDLYPEDSWNFVFGQATLVERVGVFSFCRYDPAFYGEKRGADVDRLMLRRSCKVLTHEIGHMYGLHHCVYYKCLMSGSNHLHESDSRPMHECPVCLRKFWANIGFNPADRYRALEAFYRKTGLINEAEWVNRRLKTCTGQ
jgi:archaemetzincin